MGDIRSVTYEGGLAVTPSDSAPLQSGALYAAFYTGSGGNITVVTSRGETVEFAGTAAGIIIPVAISQVKASGTAATGIVALYVVPYPGTSSFAGSSL
jgi:hypothetical protein